jgi:hypothetical protein
MTSETIDHGTLAKLVEAGTVRAARVVGQDGGWGVIVKDRKTERPLAAQRGQVRLFRKLETVVAYLKSIGIGRFDVDAMNYDPARTDRTRPDRAEALKQTHEAAAYDKWFREQVQSALDDPRPSVRHDEVSARWAKKRAQLVKKTKAGRGAKA